MAFTTPSFLQNCSTEDFLEKMKSELPQDIGTEEGSHVYNFLIATAIVAAELCEFKLPEVLKVIFPEWSYGEFLDGHAKARGIVRRSASAASGEITVTGAAGTIIPAGSLFSTASVNEEPSVDYETLEAAELTEIGTASIPVQCTQGGIAGNTTEGTVVIVSSKLTGLTGVTNEKPITGGTEEESDESLIARILDYDKSQGDNFVGSEADFKRWATSVDGVGEATVLSATDDTGLVTIILTDANGAPATEKLCESVYNFIMRPDAPSERLAPVNALLNVVPPSTMAIAIQATVELTEGATVESVKESFLTELSLYLAAAMDEKEIKYTRVAACLSAAEGVNDFANLKIGIKGGTYGTGNIPITTTQLPAVDGDDIALTSGTVE